MRSRQRAADVGLKALVHEAGQISFEAWVLKCWRWLGVNFDFVEGVVSCSGHPWLHILNCLPSVLLQQSSEAWQAISHISWRRSGATILLKVG